MSIAILPINSHFRRVRDAIRILPPAQRPEPLKSLDIIESELAEKTRILELAAINSSRAE